jgi:hypothetical protein
MLFRVLGGIIIVGYLFVGYILMRAAGLASRGEERIRGHRD